MDWKRFADRVKGLPTNIVNLEPPCPLERVSEIETQMGPLPDVVVGLLRLFNGGEFFIGAVPFVTVFGLTLLQDPPEREWSIDRFTLKWRVAMNRPNDWVIGLASYGAIFVVEENNSVSEWDSARKHWTARGLSFEKWIDFIFAEGQASMDEAI
jgi:hypothetical protein